MLILIEEQRKDFLECERSRVFCLLMVSSGLLGAFTYSIRGGVFCNAQTGNVVLISMALGNGDWKGAAYYLIPITAYGLGAAATELLPGLVKKAGLLRWDTMLVGFEVLVTLFLGFLPETAPYHISQVAINFICSMQFNTFRRAEGFPMATTFCTNHICQIGISLAKGLKKKDKIFFTKCRRHLEMLFMFITGAVTGTVLCGLFLGKAIFFGSFLLFIVFIDLLHADLPKEKGMLGRVPEGH